MAPFPMHTSLQQYKPSLAIQTFKMAYELLTLYKLDVCEPMRMTAWGNTEQLSRCMSHLNILEPFRLLKPGSHWGDKNIQMNNGISKSSFSRLACIPNERLKKKKKELHFPQSCWLTTNVGRSVCVCNRLPCTLCSTVFTLHLPAVFKDNLAGGS